MGWWDSEHIVEAKGGSRHANEEQGPGEKHPLSLVLQGSGYLEDWFGNGPSYRIRLGRIPPARVSFTLRDSCAQYERTGAIRQLTLEQLAARMEGFPSVATFLGEAAKPCSYIEAQLWDDTVIRSGEDSNANT